MALQLPGPQTSETLQEMQLADPVVHTLLQSKEQNRKPANGSLGTDKSARRFLQIWEQLLTRDGLLCRYLKPTGASVGVLQIVIPESLREEVLADLHEGVVGGHLGVESTRAVLSTGPSTVDLD